MDLNNLLIGTANFGQKYGYKKKIFLKKDLNNIFKILEKNKIKSFDTAQSYGTSEKILGKNNKKKIIFTKFNIPNVKINKIDGCLKNIINQSFNNLRKKKIEGILIHNTDFFIKNKFTQIKVIKFLSKLKKSGKVKKIGFSIYEPNEIERICEIFKPDFLQFPINIFDQRFLKKKVIRKIEKHNIEIHARSIFLRGKILRDNSFDSRLVNNQVNKFKKWCKKNQVGRVSACINFIRNYKFINKLIIGIDNKSQIEKIISILNEKKYYVPKKFVVKNFNLINPKKI